MVYIDRQRAQAMESFKAQVLQEKLQPYCSFIEQHHWSERLLTQCYHEHFYQQYYRLAKQERQQNFWQQWQKLAVDLPLAAGIFAIQTSLLEGLVLDPPQMVYQRLHNHWDEVAQHHSSRHPFFEPFISTVLSYYQEDESRWTEDLKSGMHRLQQDVARKLITVRNSIYCHALRPKKSTWKERYRLWQTLLMSDPREAAHLANLSDAEFRQCDYWQVLTRTLQQNRRRQDGRAHWDIPLSPPAWRGTEILFPQRLIPLSSKGLS